MMALNLAKNIRCVKPLHHQCVLASRGLSIRPDGNSRERCQPPSASLFDNISFDTELDMESSDVKDLYKEFDDLLETSRVQFNVGDVVTGEVYSVSSKGANVDFGGKQVGWIASAEASICKDLKANAVFEEGTVQEFRVIGTKRVKGDSGITLLSAKSIQEDVAWKRAAQLMENDIDVQGVITGYNKGGFTVDIMGLPAFLPFSQSFTGVNDPDSMMDKEVTAKILDVDKSVPRFVVSSRGAGANTAVSAEFKVGGIVEALVTSIMTYGVFVDVGSGVSGLLHITQISHGTVTDIGSLFKQGEKIKVMVLSYDRLRARVSLSTKKIEPTPGDMLVDPSLVYEKADEMAQKFRQQVALAEKQAEEEEKRLANKPLTS